MRFRTPKHSTEASASASVERPGTSVVSPTTVPGHSYDPGPVAPDRERFKLLPGDGEGVARDIDFCFETGDLQRARSQLHRLIELLGRSSDDEARRISRDEVWARRDRQTIAEVCERIDILEQDNAILACENARLRRELDLACGERDDARARISGMTL